MSTVNRAGQHWMEDARHLNSSSDDRKNQGSDHISTDHHDAGVEGCGREISCSVWKRAICTWHVFSCPTQHSSLHVIAHFPPRLFLTILKVNHLHLVTSGMGGCAVWGVHFALQPVCPVDLEHPALQPNLSPCPCPPLLLSWPCHLPRRPRWTSSRNSQGSL